MNKCDKCGEWWTPQCPVCFAKEQPHVAGSATCYAASLERIKALSAALQDCINLFNDADKSPDHKSLICTGDRREMWEEVLRRHGAA
jgi:hypothetical protein